MQSGYFLVNHNSQPNIYKLDSYKDKQEYVTRGMAKFMAEEGESTNTNSGFDFRARQAQFWKDVEMAEVLTDNDPEIANIIAQYYGNFNQKVSQLLLKFVCQNIEFIVKQFYGLDGADMVDFLRQILYTLPNHKIISMK